MVLFSSILEHTSNYVFGKKSQCQFYIVGIIRILKKFRVVIINLYSSILSLTVPARKLIFCVKHFPREGDSLFLLQLQLKGVCFGFKQQYYTHISSTTITYLHRISQKYCVHCVTFLENALKAKVIIFYNCLFYTFQKWSIEPNHFYLFLVILFPDDIGSLFRVCQITHEIPICMDEVLIYWLIKAI